MTHDQIADDILAPLWAGIPREYKTKYSYSVWDQFQDNVRSAAYTSRLSLFLSKITARLGISLNERDVKRVVAAVSSGEDREVLRALREDTALLVLMVRTRVGEARAAREAR